MHGVRRDALSVALLVDTMRVATHQFSTRQDAGPASHALTVTSCAHAARLAHAASTPRRRRPPRQVFQARARRPAVAGLFARLFVSLLAGLFAGLFAGLCAVRVCSPVCALFAGLCAVCR